MKPQSLLLSLLLLSTLLTLSAATLAKSDKKKKDKKKKETKDNKSSDALTAGQVLSRIDAGVSNAAKGFSGAVLGYVTPWNNLGYDVAKTKHPGGAKLSHVAPVWLQILPRGQGNGK